VDGFGGLRELADAFVEEFGGGIWWRDLVEALVNGFSGALFCHKK
jgi:hypothetical protein